MAKLEQSLKNDPDFLLVRPILVNEVDGKFNVYAGNQRVRAAKNIGWKVVPCIVEQGLSEEVIQQRIIKDNKTYGEWDFEILANEWEPELLIEAGFSPEELGGPEVTEVETDEEDDKPLEPPKDEDAYTKIGDVYELNSHRIACGDSTMPEVVEKCLAGAEPILMCTDPPYGVSYDASWRDGAPGGLGKKRAIGKVQNDEQCNWPLAYSLFPGNVAYVWCASLHLHECLKDLQDCEYEAKNLIIWAKQHFALSRGDYHWQHETCWYAVRKGQNHNWQGARDQSTIWEIANQNAFGSAKEDERTAHSTQKPLECMARPIRNNTAMGEGVYDPFIGSGTTLIASQSLGRTCYGIEISPAYVDITVSRWVKWMRKNNLPYSIKKNGEECTHFNG